MSKKKRDVDHDFELDEDEKEILKDFETGKLVSVTNRKEEMRRAKQAAKNFMKRENRINIRISDVDLDRVREIAADEGLPYQTLLASVIHKFVTGRLVDKRHLK